MLRKFACAAAFTLLITGLGFMVSHPAQSQPGVVRIMPLGDSITGSPGCWRALLWTQLQDAGYTNIDFVGTLPPQGCGIPHDGDNEGHGGILATNMASQNLLPAWLAATNPDIVLMHLGTNDVWSNRPTQVILDAFTTLVQQMRANNPSMRIVVQQIIPMNPSSCSECGARAVALNSAIPDWAASLTTPQSPIIVVDQWTGFNTATDTYDGVHPNSAGDQKIANKLFPVVRGLLSGNLPTSSPTTSSPTANPTTTPPTSSPTFGDTSCTATYQIVGQWQGAFQGEVRVRNTGTHTLTGWTVYFSFPNGQVVSQVWNATLTQNGAEVTAVNLSWNGTLAPGTSTAFGFIANWNGSNTAPSSITCLAS